MSERIGGPALSADPISHRPTHARGPDNEIPGQVLHSSRHAPTGAGYEKNQPPSLRYAEHAEVSPGEVVREFVNAL